MESNRKPRPTAAFLNPFTIGIAQAMARGLSFECGCFGKADSTGVGFKKLAQNAVMIGIAFMATRIPKES